MRRAQNCVIDGRGGRACGRRTCKHGCTSGSPRRSFPIGCACRSASSHTKISKSTVDFRANDAKRFSYDYFLTIILQIIMHTH